MTPLVVFATWRNQRECMRLPQGDRVVGFLASFRSFFIPCLPARSKAMQTHGLRTFQLTQHSRVFPMISILFIGLLHHMLALRLPSWLVSLCLPIKNPAKTLSLSSPCFDEYPTYSILLQLTEDSRVIINFLHHLSLFVLILGFCCMFTNLSCKCSCKIVFPFQ